MNETIEESAAILETAEPSRGALSVKGANLFYLSYIVFSLALTSFKIPGLPMSWMALTYYIPLMVVSFFLCRREKLKISTAFGFHRVKPPVLLLTVVICVGMHSVSHLISSLTNLVFPSFFDAANGEFSGNGFLVDFIGVAIIPAFFEEFVVRGGMLGSYIKTGRLRAAVLLTALLFGLQHMNPTQFFYAFAIGIVLALLFVLMGSILPGILFHFLNNAMSPIATVLEDRYGTDFVQNYFFPFSRGLSDPKSAFVTITAAVVGLVITILCLRGIARYEGSREKLRLCVHGGGGTAKLVTPALIIALILMCLMTAAATYGLFMRFASTPA